MHGGAPQQPAATTAPAKSAPAKPAAAAPAKPAPAKQEPAKVTPAATPIKPAAKPVSTAKPAPAAKPAPVKRPMPGKVAPPRKPAPAKAGSVPKPPLKPTSARPAPSPAPVAASYGPRAPYRGAIAVDADTGRILFSDNMRTPGYPASVTKLMTFLLVLEDIQSGLYGPDDRAPASQLAASMEPSSVGIRPGQSMTVHDLLLSIMVKSANDAAEVLAEHSASAHLRRHGELGPGVTPAALRAKFIERMNRRAKELGMRDTRFASPNGLPPPAGSRRGFDVSTAADLVQLGKAVVRMPKALSYTSRASCKVTGGDGTPLKLSAHNYFLPGTRDAQRLAVPLQGCDGLKTGYTEKSGSSIMLTAHRNGRRVIVVVLGSAGRHERERAAGHILRDALDAISIW